MDPDVHMPTPVSEDLITLFNKPPYLSLKGISGNPGPSDPGPSSVPSKKVRVLLGVPNGPNPLLTV